MYPTWFLKQAQKEGITGYSLNFPKHIFISLLWFEFRAPKNASLSTKWIVLASNLPWLVKTLQMNNRITD